MGWTVLMPLADAFWHNLRLNHVAVHSLPAGKYLGWLSALWSTLLPPRWMHWNGTTGFVVCLDMVDLLLT
jgi:hypothetical protein